MKARAIEVALILGVIWLCLILSSCGNAAAGFGGLVKGVGTDIQLAAENNTVE